MTLGSLALSQDYVVLLSQLKERIRSAQLRAALAVNQEVINLYWYIGKQIIEKQQQSKWGSKFIVTLSQDLRNAFPETRGFSVPNIKRMRILAKYYPDGIGSQVVTQLPWGHIVVLIFAIKDFSVREWYANKSILIF